MKTTTYFRLSLLIPFLVWGVSLLVFVIISIPPNNELISSQSTRFMDLIFLFVAFYAFGIILWIFPYLLISALLLIWSFRSQPQVMMRVFVLSPLAMTVLTILGVNLLTLITPGEGVSLSSAAINNQDFIGTNLLITGIILLWGYICVGIGFGTYKLLQRLGVIKDEGIIQAELNLA